MVILGNDSGLLCSYLCLFKAFVDSMRASEKLHGPFLGPPYMK